jgi:hypothetical protein
MSQKMRGRHRGLPQRLLVVKVVGGSSGSRVGHGLRVEVVVLGGGGAGEQWQVKSWVRLLNFWWRWLRE